MIANKHVVKIIVGIMIIAVCLCFAAVIFADYFSKSTSNQGISMDYETKIFNTKNNIDINIIMDDDEWQDLLDNAIKEEYYQCDVEINGETFYQVGIRAKGNTSLSSIANDGTTDRYSLKLEFGHYIDGQTYYGLDKLVLNNNYADATNMKEALIYDMYQYIGADASLYNFAEISVNSDYWGVYLALEAVENSFMMRNYGAAEGELYKPEGVGNDIGGDREINENINDNDFEKTSQMQENIKPENADGANGDFKDMKPPENIGQGNDMPPGGNTPPDNNEAPENNIMPDGNIDSNGIPEQMPTEPGNTLFKTTNGADLNYSDDDLDNYSAIWDGEVTETGGADHKRVVTALKNISQGTNLEDYMDVDNILKYMAVHVFSVNEDSLTGSMAHNYYLYESRGRLNIIPWDYNLALGGMNGGSASSVINSSVDNAFISTGFFDKLMENEEYKEKYYSYLRQLAEEYINNGGFDDFYNRTRSNIDYLAETDPTAFYTYDEYKKAAETLYEVVNLRGEAIEKQITDTNSRQSSEVLVDTGNIDLSVMGVMNGGGKATADIKDDAEKNTDNMQPEMSDNHGFSGDDMNGNTPEQSKNLLAKNLLTYGISFAIFIVVFVIAIVFKRRPGR